MEEQDKIEEKRARNMVWAAAGAYECEPLFLAFSPDGTADLYLNTIIGLSYQWYDGKKLEQFFQMLGGKNEELYEGLLWIALENALYRKEEQKRSALRELRKEYAHDCVRRYHRQKDYARIDRLRYGHCREILGLDPELGKEDEELLRAIDLPADLTTEQLLTRIRAIFEQFFSYRPMPVKRRNGVYFLQKIVGVFHSVGQIGTVYVRVKQPDAVDIRQEGVPGIRERTKLSFFHLFPRKDGAHDREYVMACFGQSMLGDREMKAVEQRLCTGNHKDSHLLFTRGTRKAHPLSGKAADADIVSGGHAVGFSNRELREIMDFRKEYRLQQEKNRAHFEKNRDLYRNSIQRLAGKLQVTLETEKEDDLSPATHGVICPQRVWRVLFQKNPKVFQRKEEKDTAGFSVDILIDASSSRKTSQEFLAAQGYVLEKSLERCRVPVQMYSYCSIRDYTILRLFRFYGEKGQDEAIFQYTAAGNNRDGLALRGAGYLMEQSPKERRLLLVLTDASPQDDQDLGEGAFYKNREYTDEAAVADAAAEVRALQQKGITVVGIVTGSERSAEAATKMFGRNFVKIRNINEFAETVGRVLQEQLRML